MAYDVVEIMAALLIPVFYFGAPIVVALYFKRSLKRAVDEIKELSKGQEEEIKALSKHQEEERRVLWHGIEMLTAEIFQSEKRTQRQIALFRAQILKHTAHALNQAGVIKEDSKWSQQLEK